MNNYFSCDPHYVILAWVQSWNMFEKLMKLWSPPEFFHKNMSHEQLAFMWSTLRDSSMGKMLKYFWKTHENVQSAWFFSEKHVWKNLCGRPWMHWFWSNSWGKKNGGSIISSHLKTINAKLFSFLNLYTKRSHQKALKFWRVVNSLKTWKTSKRVVWYSSARLRAFSRFANG